MPEIIAKINQWDYLKNLNIKSQDFSVEIFTTFELENEAIRLFSLQNDGTSCFVEGVYDYKTAEFMVRCHLGFHVYYDIRFISKEIKEFEGNLALFLNTLLEELNPRHLKEPDFFIRKKAMDELRADDLKENYGAMKLYIKPPHYFPTINGAMVLLDYSDFQNQNQFALFYNCMRDDFYAEKRTRGELERIPEFDCNSLEELNSLLAELPKFIDEIIRKSEVVS